MTIIQRFSLAARMNWKPMAKKMTSERADIELCITRVLWFVIFFDIKMTAKRVAKVPMKGK